MITKRTQLLNQIRYAGYHNDTATGTRLYIENRVSLQVYNATFNEGRRARANGMRCNCAECSAPGKWQVHILTKENGESTPTWKAVHPTGGQPYEYDAEYLASNMARLCYGDYPDTVKVVRVS